MKKADKFTQQTKTSGDFFIGQEVKLNTNVAKAGMGSVHMGDIGVITNIGYALTVRFASQDSWTGSFDEFLIEPTIEFAICKKAFPGVSVGQRFGYSSKPADFFNEEYFDFERKASKPVPVLEICGYEVKMDANGASWGRRSFTTEELKKVLDAVEIIENKSLQFRLGYESKHSRVSFAALKDVTQYHK